VHLQNANAKFYKVGQDCYVDLDLEGRKHLFALFLAYLLNILFCFILQSGRYTIWVRRETFTFPNDKFVKDNMHQII